ncbi:MAG: hypothetical protein IMY86_07480 [Chloroflexi bacterium]|nr:hypothetical protein [Chloroflexota bacterium]
MEKRLFHFALASCLGLASTVLVLWLGMTNTAWAVDVRYVAPPGAGGSDSGNNCLASSSPCATVQHAIDEASAGDEIHIAGGTYAPGSTVAKIDKELTLVGAYSPSNFGGPDPDMYETVLDAGRNGSVVTVTNTAGVVLLHLTLTGGDGTGNCGTVGCGGGIYLKNAELHVLHSVITGNVGSDSGRGWGGGIYADNSGGGPTVTIFGSRIENNMGSTNSSTEGSGGGVYAFYGEITLAENQIVSNSACNSTSSMCFGAGVYLGEVSHADVLTNTIRSNEANRGGTATSWGGGLYISGGSGILLADNLIEGNRANWGGGGGIDINWSLATLQFNK